MYFLKNIKIIIKGFEFYGNFFLHLCYSFFSFSFYIYVMCMITGQYVRFLLISKLNL